MATTIQKHWDTVFQTKAPDAVSWYQPHLEHSLDLIQAVVPDYSASIIDVGGGESTLVDDLLAKGYRDISVLDISGTAVEMARKRTGELGRHVTWLVADITRAVLAKRRYDLWHDRAVFHFLTESEDRAAYVRQVVEAMKPGGYVIVAAFGPQGPRKCSGLDVVRYDADSLHKEFGGRFKMVDSTLEIHRTPFGTTQQFLYCLCKVE